MATSFVHVLICLLAGIFLIVILTARYRVHAFFALLMACFVVGLGVQMPVAGIIDSVKEGFGNIMRSLGLIIVLGTTLGVILEHTGSTKVMAAFILKKVGEKHAALAMSITGFIVGLPIFILITISNKLILLTQNRFSAFCSICFTLAESLLCSASAQMQVWVSSK